MARSHAFAAAIASFVVLVNPVVASRSPEIAGLVSQESTATGSVAAGRAHSVISTPDGRVFAWGAGLRGQIGDGALTDRWSPVSVNGVTDVATVAAGAAHSLAVTRSGDLYAWGANASGRLGDGTRTRRIVPVRISSLSGVRQVAAGLAHTLAVTTDGRVFAWGLNESGQLGLGNRTDSLMPIQVPGLTNIVAVAAGDAHSLAVAQDGRAFGWGGNSLFAVGDGTSIDRLVPTAVALVDVVAVAAGAEHSLALLRSGAVYSWGRGTNGELGTGSTQASSIPRRVAGVDAISIAAGRHFSAAIRRDRHVAAWGANASGQLGDGTTTRRLRPVAVAGLESVTTLALGDLHAIAVTATGELRVWGKGESGRLGLNSEADQALPSPIAPDLVDWDGDEEGPVDTVPPSIVASTSPPLESGWMTTPVTVAFTCSDDVGIATCSMPVTISQDGPAQQVTGTAVDHAGNRTSVSVVVNMDLGAPILSISEPVDEAAVDTAQVVVTASGVDLGAGVVEARCNGAAAELNVALIRCTVPLQPGRNDIVLHAVDAVGHTAAAAVAVTRAGVPTRLSLTPSTRAAVVGEVLPLSLRDDFGASVTLAQWSTSDGTIVELSDSDPPIVTAVGIGQATITAERDGLSAAASITVSAALEPGAVRWTLPALPGFTSGQPLYANRVDASSPHLFTVDTERWGEATLRAVSSDGEVLWQQHSPGVPLLGDSFGGVLIGVLDANGEYRAYQRMGRGSVRPWRFESRGWLERPAQSAGGTLYAIEHLLGGLDVDGDEIWDKYVIAIDGATGQLIRRTIMPREIEQFTGNWEGLVLPEPLPPQCRSKRYEYPPEMWGPFAGADDRGYFLVRRHQQLQSGDCRVVATRPDRTISMGLDLVILSPTEQTQTVTVYSADCTAGFGTTVPCDVPVRAFQMIPDGIGGTLVTWQRGTQMVGQSVFIQRSLTRVGADTTLAEHLVGPQFWLELVGQAGTAVTFDDGWKAMDVVSGDIKWSSGLPNLAVLAARPDGALATLDVTTGELKIANAGVVESTQPFGLDWFAVYHSGEWIGLRSNQLTAVVGEFSDATRWAAIKGNAQGQQTTRTPGVGILAKTHLAFETPLDLVRYRHVSIRIVPRDQRYWLSQEAIQLPGVDEFGNRFFTMGAGSNATDTNAQCSGVLQSDINRPNDVGTPPWDPLERLAYPATIEQTVITSLLNRDDAYPDDLPYACWPEDNPGFYNSNSFAHGLLNAAGVSPPRLPTNVPSLVPGWRTPVPLSKFQ